MSINERARARIELDGQQAEAQLEALRAKAAAMRKELNQMRLSKDPGYATKQREFQNLNNKIKQLSKSSFDLNGTLRNLSGASMRDLTRAQSVLTAQIRQTNRSTLEGRTAFAQKTEQLRRVRAEIAGVRTQMMGMQQNMSLMQRVAGGFNRYFMMATTTIATFSGIIMGLRSTVNVFNEFESSVAELQAITGLAGDELDWMAQRAQQASISVTETGIRFSNSAKEIVDAYTMVGSKRPELLANKEALAEVTEAAMTLSKAATIDLNSAATALTTVMNQFNASADEATRIINVLGAGSKVGAANVDYLNRVIERSGTAARSAGLTIEELVGVVEGVAPRFSQPADAATALRNVFLRLQTLDDDINPAIVGVEKALENLARKQLSTAEITQMFGLRSVNMVMALIDGREDIVRYTDAVTDTGIALEQAAINSETNAAALEQARNRAALLRIELGEKIAPALTFSTNAFSYFLKALKAVMENWDHYRRLIIATIAVWAAYNQAMIRARIVTLSLNAAMKAKTVILTTKNSLLATARAATLLYAAAQARLTGNINRSIAAMRLFRAAMASTPWGAVLAGVTALVSAIVIYTRRKNEQTQAEKAHQRVHEQITKQYAEESSQINAWRIIAENANLPLERRRIAIEELNKIIPGYNAKLSDEGRLITANANAIDTYLDKLRQKISYKAFEDEITEQIVKQEEARRKLIDTEEKFRKQREITQTIISNLIERGLSEEQALRHQATKAAEDAEERVRREIEKSKAEVDRYQATIDQLTQSYTKYSQQVDDTVKNTDALSQAMELVNEASKITGFSVDELEEKLSLLQAALRHVEKGGEDYNRIQSLITTTQEQLNDVIHAGTGKLIEAENAYRQLTSAINDARAQLQHFVAIGDFDSAKATDAVIQNLEANKLVMDGIIEAGGDVHAFIDSLADSTQARLEETQMFNEMFLENWQESSDLWLAEQEEQRQLELQQELEDHQRRMEYARLEAEAQMEYARQVADVKRQLTDAALQHGFNLHSQFLQREYNSQINSLNRRRDFELANENLTESEKQAIHERYAREEAKLKEEQFRRQKAADIIQATISAALAVARAIAAPPGFPLNAPQVVLAGMMGAMQVTAIAAAPTPQFAKGKYVAVTGQDDGITYNARWIGKPKTGLYTRPALFAEQGEEIIIDSPTTRNLKINHPEILEGIMMARVPQYYSGSYPATPPRIKQYAEGNLNDASAPGADQTTSAVSEVNMELLQKAIENLHETTQLLLNEGVRGVWVYSDLMAMKEKVETIEKQSQL